MKFHVRYDEIALKGGRRRWYESRLVENLAKLLEVPKGHVQRLWGRILIDLPDEDDPRRALDVIARSFGVQSASVIHSTPMDLDAAAEVSLRLATEQVEGGKRTFKFEVRRGDKSFPHTSYEVAADLGGRVLEALESRGLSVDVHDPEFVIGVEIRGGEEGIAVHCGSVPGPGGIPVGTSGRALNLLSGGIDSPVAAWHMLKRGLHVDHVYFHAFPYTGDRVLEKVLTIARAVSRWTPNPTRVFVPSTTKIQDAIQAGADERLRIVLLRRSMYRLADAIRRTREHKALITGEALGQVASQTPENLVAVEAVVPETLVLRPLIGMDKQDIVARAEVIGTYETSILPYQDCCSLFAPKSPETRASLKSCLKAERELDLAPLEAESLAGLQVYRIERGGSAELSANEGLERGSNYPAPKPEPAEPSA